MTDVTVKQIMYGYVVKKSERGESTACINIPELFPVIDNWYGNGAKMKREKKGNINIFKNITPPAISDFITCTNYLELNKMNPSTELLVNDRVIVLIPSNIITEGAILGKG